MKPVTNKIFVCLISLTVSQLGAEPLRDLVQTALDKNYQIKIVKNLAQIEANNNTLGNTGILPSLNVEGTYSISGNSSNQDFADGTSRESSGSQNSYLNIQALASWPLFSGFTFYARRSQLKTLQQLGELNSKFYIEQTVSDIAVAYYQMQLAQQLLKNYRQILAISKFRLNLESKRKEVGAGKATDYSQALVDFQTDSIRVLTGLHNIQALQYQINRVLGRDIEKTIALEREDFKVLPLPDKDSLLQDASKANVQLAREHLQELLAETQLRLNQMAYLPKIDVFAGYQYSKSTADLEFNRESQNYGPRAGVNVHFNLFSGGETYRSIKNAKVSQQNSQLKSEDVSLQIKAEVLTYYQQYQTVAAQIALAESNEKEMQQVYKTAEEQLKLGAINAYDFRLTQNGLLNSEQTLMQLKYALKIIEINLARLCGRVLDTYM